jgi:hypothetical protein
VILPHLEAQVVGPPPNEGDPRGPLTAAEITDMLLTDYTRHLMVNPAPPLDIGVVAHEQIDEEDLEYEDAMDDNDDYEPEYDEQGNLVEE